MKKKLPSKFISKLLFKKNRITFSLAILFSVITALLNVAFALLLQLFIDGISKGLEYLIKLIFFSLIFLGTYLIAGLVANYFQNKYVWRASLNIRQTLVERILRKSSRDFNKNPWGTYLSTVTNDVSILEQNYIKSTIAIILQCVMVIAGLAVMLYLNYLLTIYILVASLIPLILSGFFNVRLKSTQEKISANYRNYTSLMKEIFIGNNVIKSFHIEKEICLLNKKSAAELEKSKEKNGRIFGNMMVLIQGSTFIIVLVIFAFGSFLVTRNLLTAGGVLAFLQLLNNVTSPINQLAENLSKRRSCTSIIQRIEEVSFPSEEQIKGVSKDNFTDNIRVKDLSFAYESSMTDILNGINFVFEKGKSYAIVGESGCGKSTFLKLLNGYYDTYKGYIEIDGIEVKNLSERSISNIFGIIQQETFIFDTTIENNITLYQNWPKEEINRVLIQSGLDKVIQFHGKDMLCGENGCNLSGGERQRIAVARALLRGNDILLVDEATSSLDSENTVHIEKELLGLKDVTKIVVTHKLNASILQMYDSILVIKNGQIEEYGSYLDLINKKGILYSLCKISE